MNNLLKTDCQRLAILLLVSFGVYGVLFKFYCNIGSHLAGR
ncbi:DUF3265 domain-containing protein [Vibrio parahaemolyticus]|nr:DUF3265 domain-containing protein [Vibrio parahaemolyticus]